MADKEFDVVIVGSGAGGGTVAASLAGKGLKVAVLEWGPKFKEEEYTGKELEMARRLYFDGGGFLTKDQTMSLAFAKAYGGSTVVYTGTSLTLSQQTLHRWAVPGLEYEDLMKRSKKYLEQNGVHLQPPDRLNDNNNLFRAGCEKLGYKHAQFPVNLRGCKSSGLCNLGCPNQAKQGTHRVQLPAAEAGGVEVITNCKVERVYEGGLDCTVRPNPLGHPSKWAAGEYKVKARKIVVSAGAVQSPALLLRSGLGGELPALGRYFTTHPALILVAQHAKPITNYVGHPKSFYCDHFEHDEKFLLETCMYFPFVTAKNLAGFGAEHSALMKAFDRLQMILVLAIDEALASNRVTVDGHGEAVVDYRLTPEVLTSLHASMLASAKIFFAGGAERVHAPAGVKFLIEKAEQGRLDELIPLSGVKPGKVSISSAHLMGGCRMGADARDSVTDAWGRVHGKEWLYVADASLFPQAAAINPYITIMALADRVAERVSTS